MSSTEVFVLGTSGMLPLVNRHLTSVLLRRDGKEYLFDCGEGTQVALKKASLGWKKIDSIFISHMHSDHLTGLLGMLMLSSQVDRLEPLNIYGPSALEEFLDVNRRILDMYINYKINFFSTDNKGIIYKDDEITINAFPLIHTKPCTGFSVVEKDRPGEFFPDKALSLGVPKGALWGKLQKGEDVLLDSGKIVKSSDVVGEKRKGLKFSFVTDTLYFPEIAEYVYKSDLLIIEGMFEHALKDTAHEKKHMTALEAASVAKDAMCKSAGLIHYSPRYTNRELKVLLDDARSMCSNVFLTRDGMNIPLSYEK